MNDSEKYLVPGLLRGLTILESFSAEKKELGLSEIALLLDINRSSAFRLVQTLEYAGFIRKTPQKTYTLDLKVLHLGYGALANIPITESALPIMKKLRDATGVAVHLSILDNNDIIYISNVQALGAFTSNIKIGTRWPAYATVIGLLLLTALSEQEIRKRFASQETWIAYSDRTVKNVNELVEKVISLKNAPYLISWQQFKKGMLASAAPIRNQHTQKVEYVLSISCPASTFTADKFEHEITPLVTQAADEISQLIHS